jgi:hypothetical protein
MKLYRCPPGGACRTVTLFAWQPIKLDNRDVIWLEKYKDDQEYSYGFDTCDLRWRSRRKYNVNEKGLWEQMERPLYYG